MTTTTYPRPEQTELYRLRDELADLLDDVQSVEARIDDEDPLAVELAGLADDLGRGLRRLEQLVADIEPTEPEAIYETR